MPHHTNDVKLKESDLVMCDEISDPNAVFCVFKMRKTKYEPRYKYVRNEKTLNIKNFNEDMWLICQSNKNRMW